MIIYYNEFMLKCVFFNKKFFFIWNKRKIIFVEFINFFILSICYFFYVFWFYGDKEGEVL